MCERDGRYVEAELAKNRIAELKEQEHLRTMEEMHFMHEQQRQDCESAHIEQYQHFNTHWDNELQAAAEEDQRTLQGLEEHHTQLLEDHRAKLEHKLMSSFRASAPLLNLRK